MSGSLRRLQPRDGRPVPSPESSGPSASGAEHWARGLAGEGELAPADHEALLALALGDEAGQVSDAERAEATRLADALEQLGRSGRAGRPLDPQGGTPEGTVGLLAVAEAVRATAGRVEIDPLSHERLLRRALGPARARARESSRWVSVGALAAAAAVAIWWAAGPAWQSTGGGTGGPVAGATGRAVLAARALVPARSTQPLFDPAVRFPVRGGESDRVDRIATARAGDLRANRYAMWGVP